MTERTWTEADWPATRSDIDAIYQAITRARIAGRWKVIGVQMSADRVNAALMDDEWRLFGIDWVIASEPLEPDCFRLIFDSGPSVTYRFPDRDAPPRS